MRVDYDCRRCGACCCNPSANRAKGFNYYIEVEPKDSILERRDLVRKHVVYDAEGTPHLALTAEGRCKALRGPVGGRVACQIYGDRPSPCRRVQPGDDLCLRYRRDQGLAIDRPIEL